MSGPHVLLARALEHPAVRHAGPGEFTRRALFNGKLDLLQAEAIGDLIDARSQPGRRAAIDQLDGGLSRRVTALRDALVTLEALIAYDIDFPEEDDGPVPRDRVLRAADDTVAQLEALLATARAGELVREGAVVVIAGAPNAGKSSLFNALLGRRRAIVTDVPGTTRDALEAVLDAGRWPLRLVDTAGLRDTDDAVERLGVQVSADYLGEADVVLACGDSAPAIAHVVHVVTPMTRGAVIRVRTKADLETGREGPAGQPPVATSAELGTGLTDGLSGDNTDRLTHADELATCRADAVAQGADAATRHAAAPRRHVGAAVGHLLVVVHPIVDVGDELEAIGGVPDAPRTQDRVQRAAEARRLVIIGETRDQERVAEFENPLLDQTEDYTLVDASIAWTLANTVAYAALGCLDAVLRTATAGSFDRVDTDGCMSTNDTVLLMASGASGHTPDEEAFTALLTEVAARGVVRRRVVPAELRCGRAGVQISKPTSLTLDRRPEHVVVAKGGQDADRWSVRRPQPAGRLHSVHVGHGDVHDRDAAVDDRAGDGDELVGARVRCHRLAGLGAVRERVDILDPLRDVVGGEDRVLGAHHGRLVHQEVARPQPAVGRAQEDVAAGVFAPLAAVAVGAVRPAPVRWSRVRATPSAYGAAMRSMRAAVLESVGVSVAYALIVGGVAALTVDSFTRPTSVVGS